MHSDQTGDTALEVEVDATAAGSWVLGGFHHGEAGDEPTPGHDQKGTHGGGIGICPVYVPEGATAKGSPLANGVAIKITPKGNADELEKDIEGRIARSTEWMKTNNGSGGGKGTGGGGGKGTGGGGKGTGGSKGG
jgi:hypothetical protein